MKLPFQPSRLAAALLVLVPLLVGLFLPSQRLFPDGLDELMIVEAPQLEVNPKHPAVEAVLWLGWKVLKVWGYEGRAIRPVQLWNALWLTVALAGLVMATRAWLSKGRLAAFACLPFLSVSLHWAADPFLAYWPPGLAALSWAFFLAKGPPTRARILGLILLLTLMVFINPIFCLALPAAAFFAAGRFQEEPRTLLFRSSLLVGLPPFFLFFFLSTFGSPNQAFGATTGIFGVWTAQTLPQGFEAARDLFFTPRQELTALFPGYGELVKSGCDGLVLVAMGLVFLSLLKAGRWRQAWPLFLAVPPLVVLLWWAPQQRFFYLLPLWLLFALWPDLPEEHTSPALGSAWWSHVRLLPALALALVNFFSYLGPVQSEDPRRAWIVACAQKFQPADRLYFPLFGDPTFTYFGGVETASLLERFRSRRPGQTTFDSLKELLAAKTQEGRAIYFQVPRKNQEWVPRRIRERAELDYDEESLLARLEWGEEVDCGPARFRRLVAVK